MSRSQNTERVRALTKAHLEQAKALKTLELDLHVLRKFQQQIAEVIAKLSEQVGAVGQMLEHLETSGQVDFKIEEIVEDSPKGVEGFDEGHPAGEGA